MTIADDAVTRGPALAYTGANSPGANSPTVATSVAHILINRIPTSGPPSRRR
jgi:hypothetical protein